MEESYCNTAMRTLPLAATVKSSTPSVSATWQSYHRRRTHLILFLTLLLMPLGGALMPTAGPLPPCGVLGPPPRVDGLAVDGSQFLSGSRECTLTSERVDFEVARRSSRPACFQVCGLVSHAECDHLIAEADAMGMEQAMMASGDERGSCGVAWLPIDSDAVAASLCGALEQLFLQPEVLEQSAWARGGRWENMQCLQYSPGGEFLAHYDADQSVHRMLTVILYLNGEGETWFPLALQEARDASQGLGLANGNPPRPKPTLAAAINGKLDSSHDGLLLRPGKGDAVAFYNLLDNGSRQIDRRSLHAGLPASVEKRVATLWYHLDLHSARLQSLPLAVEVSQQAKADR